MAIDDIPLLSMIKGRLGYLNQRQRLIAENVANSDPPGFTPKDLKPFTFDAQLKAAQGAGAGVQPVQTNPMHLPGSHPARSGWKGAGGPDSEVTLDGNKVVLEDQMIKMTEARMNYDAAVSFYQKSLGLLRTAVRAPGK